MTFVPEANRVLWPDRPASTALNAAHGVEGELAFRNLLNGLIERPLSISTPPRVKVLLEKIPERGEAPPGRGKSETIRWTRGDPGFCDRARGQLIVHNYL